MDIAAFQNSPSGHLVRTIGGHYAFVPDVLPPSLEWDADLVVALSAADRALGELAGVGRALPNPHLLIRPFVRREAVLSSRIEGTRASASDLYAFEAGQLGCSASEPDVREVHNYVRALEHGVERLSHLPFSLRLVRELHAVLMDGVRGDRQAPGEFRGCQNWIGAPGCDLDQASYVPPPVTEMRDALGALEQFVHVQTLFPPLICLGLIHYQFEAIHPFLDGNSRIGRLLIALLLCAWDLLPQPLLYLSVYLHTHRDAYYDLLLAVSRDGAWEAWLTFFLRGIADQARDAIARIQRIQDLRERYREQFQTARAAARLLQVIDLLFAHPLLTVGQIEEALGIAYNTAHQYIRHLEEAGLVHEITGRARNRLYRADEVLEAIEAPLG